MLDKLQSILPKRVFFVVATLWYLAMLYSASAASPSFFRYAEL